MLYYAGRVLAVKFHARPSKLARCFADRVLFSALNAKVFDVTPASIITSANENVEQIYL